MENEYQKILFGAQKQGARQNEAVAAFVSANMEKKGKGPEQLRSVLEETANEVADKNSATLEEQFFISYLLGTKAFAHIASGNIVRITQTSVGDNGKIVFQYLEDGDIPDADWELAVKKEESDEERAWKIVHQTLNSLPPSVRETLPADEPLAAVLALKEYNM